MRKQTNFLFYSLILMGVFLLFANSCKKDDDNKGDNNGGNNAGIPVLTTTAVTDITQTTAISGGNITSDGGATVTARGVCWSTGQTPTISNNKTTNGTGAGLFSSSLIGLSPETTYYVRAYATNSNGTGYGSTMSFTTLQGVSGSSFTDPRDNNVYQTVAIGNQTWMAENLKYLPSVVGPGTGSQTTPYYYVYDYNGTSVADAKAISNYNTYGVLYNWPAAMAGSASSTANPSGVQGICPSGWHLPSDAEWKQLEMFLGMSQAQADNSGWRGTDEGGKLKETGTMHWISPNTGATNSSGFTALPSGNRANYGAFANIGYRGYWWSATGYNTETAWGRRMNYDYSDIGRYGYDIEIGFSVRCLRDN